ncbi:MAG: OmpA family protein [Candidatus Thiothrix sulfatifontis]|nr:MAG: OmpA family protein [Candidatus Thiothrix sulfatifontis]
MEKNSSCCCGTLPAMWWWLLTLLGLPLLFFLMTWTRQEAVEADLATRSTAALKAAGMDWATVNLDQRGRDVQLTGTAASVQARDAALQVVQNVYGVRDVQNRLQMSNVSTPQPSQTLQEPAAASVPQMPVPVATVEPEPTPAPTPEQQLATAEPVPAPEQQSAVVDAAPSPEQQAVMNCQQQLNDAMAGKTVLFETNKSAIKRDSLALLDSLAGIISDCKTVIAGRGIQVSGHTDNVGNDAYNQTLSTQRANAVKEYLVKKGVDGALIKSAGFGESQPIASNDTEAERSRNRRIAFEINPE